MPLEGPKILLELYGMLLEAVLMSQETLGMYFKPYWLSYMLNSVYQVLSQSKNLRRTRVRISRRFPHNSPTIKITCRFQLKSSQSKIGSLEERLKKKENNFDKLKEDFEAYKIRAHNALQKGKLETNIKTNEEKLRAEIEILSQTVKELRTRLDNSW